MFVLISCTINQVNRVQFIQYSMQYSFVVGTACEPHGVVNVQTTPSQPIRNVQTTFVCVTGYRLTGSQRAMCNSADGTWGQLPSCTRKLTVLTLKTPKTVGDNIFPINCPVPNYYYPLKDRQLLVEGVLRYSPFLGVSSTCIHIIMYQMKGKNFLYPLI